MEQDLSTKLKSLGIQSFVIDMSIDAQNYPYSGRQMLVAPDRICQHVELRAKTLADFIGHAERFWDSMRN